MSFMKIIGKSPIHPVLFYSGKISGYGTWIVLALSLMNIDVVTEMTFLYNKYLAIATLTLGFFAVILSIINLGTSTRIGLPSEKTKFKTSGLYKLSRNPMYFGFNLFTIAAMIYTLNTFIVVLGLYSIVVYHFIIIGEERFLEKRFADDYLKYKQKVRRYI